MDHELPPSERLVGLTLGHYLVTEKVDHGPDYTGGQRSVAYLATKDGTTYFVKAIDFSFFRNEEKDPEEDLATTMERALTQFNFERTLLQLARDHSLSRIVRVVASGSIAIDRIAVFYLVFDKAKDNMRALLAADQPIATVTKLQVLHHVATGLKQLHRLEIAHQDVKPSNILSFGPQASIPDFKLTDLGQASKAGLDALHDGQHIPGDQRFAPLELCYRHKLLDFHQRRTACDVYLLGSMIVYLLLGLNVTQQVIGKLPPEQRPQKWGEPYSKVLPFVRQAYADFLASIEHAWPCSSDPKIGRELSEAVRQLCDPDPELRGDPITRLRHEPLYSLERYISLFASLIKRAELAQRIDDNRLKTMEQAAGAAD